MTDKYLIFRLEKWVNVNINSQILNKEPCFELVKEFKVKSWDDDYNFQVAYEFAEQYSSDNRVRVLVIKGTVFGG